MADTQRTKTQLLTTLFQDGQVGGITAQDMRDLIVSLSPDYAGLEFTTDAETSIAVAGTYVKAAGTTVITNSSSNMTNGATNNRLVYTGAQPRHFHIVLQASIVLASGANQRVSMALWKFDSSEGTGSILSHSEAFNTLSGTAVEQITSHADTMLATNDYIEIHVTNNTNTNNMTVEYGYLFGVSMIM